MGGLICDTIGGGAVCFFDRDALSGADRRGTFFRGVDLMSSSIDLNIHLYL